MNDFDFDFDAEPVRTHLERFVRNGLGLPLQSDYAPPVLPIELARLLLRAEEYELAHRDQWGNWEYGFGENFRRGMLWEPEVDRWLAAWRLEFSEAAELVPLWPEKHPFAICLTHDVDLVSDQMTVRQMLRSMRTALPGAGSHARERLEGVARCGVRATRALRRRLSSAPPVDALERCVAIENDGGVTASYFFTVFPGQSASHVDCVYEPGDMCRFRGRRQSIATLMSTLAGEGFDVGLHGSYRSSTDGVALAQEKQTLERATGLALTTTRQHFLRWDVRRTARAQTDAGFAADATLGFNRNLGFRAGTALPFHHFDLEHEERLDVLLLPLLVHDTPLLRSDGLELDLLLAQDAVRRIVDAVAETGGLATFLIHPNNLDRPDVEDLLRWLIDYGLGQRAWFASVRDVNLWWRGREARLFNR